MPIVPHLPPRARRDPVRHERFGVAWDDAYAWLRDPDWPAVQDVEVLAHLQAENAWFRAAMTAQAPLVARLYDELCARLAPDEESVPAREGAFDSSAPASSTGSGGGRAPAMTSR